MSDDTMLDWQTIQSPTYSLWNNLQGKYRPNLWVLKNQLAGTRGFIGVNTPGIANIHTTDPKDNIHIYDKGVVDSVLAEAGEHRIYTGGYVCTMKARNSVAEIYGHVYSLTADIDSQVFIYKDAYIDRLTVMPGAFVRIEKGANINIGNILKNGKAEISTMAHINTLDIDEEAVVCHMPDPDVYPIALSICFEDIESRNKFCKAVTDEYRATDMLKLGKLVLYDVCNCFVLPSIGTDSWSVHMSSNTKTEMSREEIEVTVNDYIGKKDAVTVWLDGISSDDIKREEQHKAAVEEAHKWEELNTLRAKLEPLEIDLGIKKAEAPCHTDYDAHIGPFSFDD